MLYVAWYGRAFRDRRMVYKDKTKEWNGRVREAKSPLELQTAKVSRACLLLVLLFRLARSCLLMHRTLMLMAGWMRVID